MSAALAIQPPALTVECDECWGAGEVTPDHPGSPWARMRRCPAYCDDGQVAPECGCGDAAEVLVADAQPVCRWCAEDYVQGPVPMERAPWQQDDNETEAGP